MAMQDKHWLFFVLKLLSFKISEQNRRIHCKTARISRYTFNGRRYQNVYNGGSTPQSANKHGCVPFGFVFLSAAAFELSHMGTANRSFGGQQTAYEGSTPSVSFRGFCHECLLLCFLILLCKKERSSELTLFLFCQIICQC